MKQPLGSIAKVGLNPHDFLYRTQCTVKGALTSCSVFIKGVKRGVVLSSLQSLNDE